MKVTNFNPPGNNTDLTGSALEDERPLRHDCLGFSLATIGSLQHHRRVNSKATVPCDPNGRQFRLKMDFEKIPFAKSFWIDVLFSDLNPLTVYEPWYATY